MDTLSCAGQVYNFEFNEFRREGRFVWREAGLLLPWRKKIAQRDEV